MPRPSPPKGRCHSGVRPLPSPHRYLLELERFFGVLRLRHRPPTELLFSLMESCAEDALPVASLSRITLS